VGEVMNSKALEIMVERPKQVKKPATKNAITNFSQRKIELEQAPFFFPSGYENIFLSIYFLIVPYLMGLLFLFFYIAKANGELFLSISSKSSYLFTWAIGYEVLAAMFFIFIIKLFMDSIKVERLRNQINPQFRRP